MTQPNQLIAQPTTTIQVTGTLAEWQDAQQSTQPLDLSVVQGATKRFLSADLVNLASGPYRRKLKLDIEALAARIAERNNRIALAAARLEYRVLVEAEDAMEWTDVQAMAEKLFKTLDLGYRATFALDKVDWDKCLDAGSKVFKAELKLYTDRKGSSSYAALSSERTFSLMELDLSDDADLVLLLQLRDENAADRSLSARLRRQIDRLPEFEEEAKESLTLASVAGDAEAKALLDGLQALLDQRHSEAGLSAAGMLPAPAQAPESTAVSGDKPKRGKKK